MFSEYAKYYDLLYENKEYAAEAEYTASIIRAHDAQARSLLDVGCGTGKHANYLSSRGFEVAGVDIAPEMIRAARDAYPQLHFHEGDARNFQLPKKFDVITSLFHVASYQVSNADMRQYLDTIQSHLKPAGLFFFDFWYGPAVQEDKPVVRIKRLENNDVKLIRIAEPVQHFNENTITVNYEFIIKDKKAGQLHNFSEVHKVRYFSLPEIQLNLELSGFEMLNCYDWLTMKPPSTQSWYVCIAASKR